MLSFSSLFRWIPRRRKHNHNREGGGAPQCAGTPQGEGAPANGKRKGRRRRYIYAKATALAPIRTRASSAADAGPAERYGTTPLSGRSSAAFSDDEYHDALEEFAGEASFSSRTSTSVDDSQMGSPGSAGAGYVQHPDAAGPQRTPPSQRRSSLAGRLSSWWEGRKHGHSSSQGHNGFFSPQSTPRTESLSPRMPGSPLQSVAAEELIEPSPDATKMGCISLFTASQAAVAHKKFLRLSKPHAGSSFRTEAPPPEEAPPTPEQQLQPHRHSAVGRLLEKLSPPGSPRPFFQRLLSSHSSTRRKTAEEGPSSTAAAWEPADGTTFSVRSLNYMRSKQKVASGPCIYRLLGVDVYSFDFKIFHIAQHVQLPEAPRLGPEAQALPPDQQLPPLLVINLQLPWYPASLFGANDGHGYSLVYYFALPEGWEPSQVENKAALGLVQRFMGNKREFDGTPTRDRLKLIPRIVNVAEWAEQGPLTTYEHRLLMNYNDKPLLTRPQHRFYTGPNYLEIDLDVHNYAFIARKAFHGFIHRLAPVVFENAFVVQGNRPEELPEQVLAAARVYRVDFDRAQPFPAKSLDELGNGTGPAHDGEAAR